MRISDWSSDVCSSDLSGWNIWGTYESMTIMTAPPFSPPRPSAEELQALRETVARVAAARGPVLPFGVGPIDHLLAAGGLDGAGLHEVAAASASWSDAAATTLFAAGIAARFAAAPGVSALWALTDRKRVGGGKSGSG